MTTAIERVICYTQFPRGAVLCHTGDLWGRKHQGQSGGSRTEVEARPRACIVVSKGRNRTGEMSRFRIC